MKYQNLIETAKKARIRAYAPYSGFKVGAALLLEDGTVVCGCNIENASYGLTNCAERTAVFKAVSCGIKEFVAIAIVSDSAFPVSPCGACRQVLMEFSPEMTVIMANLKGDVIQKKLQDLLPSAFTSHDLQQEEE